GDGPRKGNGADEERHGGFQGWSKSKAALDEQVANETKKAAFEKRVTVGLWRLHDIRRTVATRMAKLCVQPHIIQAVLNHVSGHKAGVAGVYNRSSYAAEKRIALDLWGKHVQALVEGDRSGDPETTWNAHLRRFL